MVCIVKIMNFCTQYDGFYTKHDGFCAENAENAEFAAVASGEEEDAVITAVDDDDDDGEKPEDKEEQEDEDEDVIEDVSGLKVAELKQRLAGLGLATDGKKAVLVNRLVSKKDEFCIENDEVCIKIDEFCTIDRCPHQRRAGGRG